MVGVSTLGLIPSRHDGKAVPATSLMHAVFQKTHTNRGLCRGRRNSSINQHNMTVLPNVVVQAIARARNSSPLFVSVRDLPSFSFYWWGRPEGRISLFFRKKIRLDSLGGCDASMLAARAATSASIINAMTAKHSPHSFTMGSVSLSLHLLWRD